MSDKPMTVRQLEAELNKLLKNLAGGKVDRVLDKVVIMRIQNDDGMTVVGGLVGLVLEVPCGSEDDVQELVLEGDYNAEVE